MDTGKLLLFGGIAAGVAWYEGWLSALGFPGPTAAAATPATPVTTTTTTTATPPAAPVGPSLDTLFALMTTAAAGDSTIVGGLATPDTWNFYLSQVYPNSGLTSPPDPIQVFGNRNPMTAIQYWAGMAPWLRANKGLAGIGRYGLGAVGSLGMRGYR